jgi:hypothetical protein
MPMDLGIEELLSFEHAFGVWVAYFEALKATKFGASAELIRSPDSWENVKPPTLASLARANDTFKTPRKLKLGPMSSPSHVPNTPHSKRPALTLLEGLQETAEEEDKARHLQYGIQAMMADWNKLDASFKLI